MIIILMIIILMISFHLKIKTYYLGGKASLTTNKIINFLKVKISLKYFDDLKILKWKVCLSQLTHHLGFFSKF